MIEEKNSNTTQPQAMPNPPVDKQEIDLMEILRKIISIRKTLYKAAGVGLIIGIVVALSIPKQYTVKVTLSPEMGDSKGENGLAGLAASFLESGASTGAGSDALNALMSADIVSSTPFLLELFDMKVVSSNGEETTLQHYLDEQSAPWWNYVIDLPGMVIGGVKSIFTSEEKEEIATNNTTNKGAIELTKKEAAKVGFLQKNVTAMMDKKSAITAITVTLQDPKVAASVADSVVRKLQQYIANYRTSKAKEDCVYLEKLYKDRQQEYYSAQKKYANYLDSHDNLILQSVRAEQERLQNDMNLSYQVYSQVANQLQVARAKVQEVKPVFAVVEPAVIPRQPSGISTKVYVLLFMFASVICVMGWALIGKLFWNTLHQEIKGK